MYFADAFNFSALMKFDLPELGAGLLAAAVSSRPRILLIEKDRTGEALGNAERAVVAGNESTREKATDLKL